MRRAVLGVIIVLLGGIALGQAAATVQETGNAVVAGQLAAVPTIRCIGLHWPIRGDADADATGSLRYREAGKGPWREALGLWRVAPKEVNIKESTVGGFKTYFIGGLPKWNKNMQKYLLRHYAANYLAGSIFNLKPGTAYE
ncbi:MAG: hypothetical protein J7M19_06595, partial [Planctomycetes bacterium]|nr:hypothetical protein [Planctomycetota bacterium]